MKHLILLGALIGSSFAQAEQIVPADQACPVIAKVANMIIDARFTGKSVIDTMKLFDKPDRLITHMTSEAFKLPIPDDAIVKETKAEEFINNMTLECYATYANEGLLQ